MSGIMGWRECNYVKMREDHHTSLANICSDSPGVMGNWAAKKMLS